MNQRKTTAIVLTRTEYGEADRILTVLTPDAGKLSLIAKGVRRVKSKLAGGIELFSVSEISYIVGRGSVSTLISARLIKHYGHIATDIDRTMLGYDLIKLLHKCTEDEPEAAYFELLDGAFSALDDQNVSVDVIRLWFSARLLRLAGHTPNLQTATDGEKLSADENYEFDYDAMAFCRREDGNFSAPHIKILRLLFSANSPAILTKIEGIDTLVSVLMPLMQTIRSLHLRA